MKEIIEIDGRKWDLREEFRIDEHRLLHQMLEHPSKVLFWGRLLAKTRHRREYLEKCIKVIESLVYDEFKRSAATGKLKISEKWIEAKIRRDKQWVEYNEEYHRVRKLELDLSSIMDALSHRRDMFISGGAQIRSEQDHPIGRQRQQDADHE